MAAKKTKKKKAKSASGAITEFVMGHPLFGAHAHIMPVPDWERTQPHFSSISGYAGADLVTARGPLGIGEAVFPPTDSDDYTAKYFELWRSSRFTGYCMATELACRDLLGLEHTEENAEAIGEAIACVVGKKPLDSYRTVLQDKANLRWLIKDSICMPEATDDDLYPTDRGCFLAIITVTLPCFVIHVGNTFANNFQRRFYAMGVG